MKRMLATRARARRVTPSLRLEALESRRLLASFTVTNVSDSGPGSLRQAILDSNNAVGATNTIDFAIPGTGIRTIAPTSALPATTTSVVITLGEPPFRSPPTPCDGSPP